MLARLVLLEKRLREVERDLEATWRETWPYYRDDRRPMTDRQSALFIEARAIRRELLETPSATVAEALAKLHVVQGGMSRAWEKSDDLALMTIALADLERLTGITL